METMSTFIFKLKVGPRAGRKRKAIILWNQSHEQAVWNANAGISSSWLPKGILRLPGWTLPLHDLLPKFPAPCPISHLSYIFFFCREKNQLGRDGDNFEWVTARAERPSRSLLWQVLFWEVAPRMSAFLKHWGKVTHTCICSKLSNPDPEQMGSRQAEAAPLPTFVLALCE